MSLPVAALALVLACGEAEQCYQPAGRARLVDMPVRVTGRTPGGLAVDDPGAELDQNILDRTAQAVRACVEMLGELTDQERWDAACFGVLDPVLRSCLVVKAAPSWRVSACTGEEVFDCAAPPSACLAKGQQPTPECPCSCRAAVELNSTVVTAPDMELLPWRLTELMTGCNSLEAVPRLAACGDPRMRQ